jgi:Domain of unknown function (DUF4189)
LNEKNWERNMKTNKILVLVVGLISSVPAAHATGAVARNPQNNDSAVVVNKKTSDDAAHDAKLACGNDCVIVKTFQKSGVAYAADHHANSTRYGIGEASDAASAAEIALNNCQSEGGSCTVMSSGCDGK